MVVTINVQSDLGTVVDANAYDSVAAFKAYHVLRGNDIGTATDDQIAVALIRATDYIDTRFSFPGTLLVPGDATVDPVVVAQTTAWPRTADPIADGFTNWGFASTYGWGNPYGPTTIAPAASMVVPAGIPIALKKAAHEYAFRALSNSLFVDVVPDSSGRLVKSRRDKVDVIESEVEYAPGQSVNGQFVMPAYPQADLFLARAGLIVQNARTVSR